MINRSEIRENCFAKALILNSPIPGQMRNMSLKGCKLALPLPLKKESGDSITIAILPQQETGLRAFTVEGIIRWQHPDDVFWVYGIEFTEPVPPDEQWMNIPGICRNPEETRKAIEDLYKYYISV